MLKKLFFGIIGLVVVLAAVGMLLPRQIHVERSVQIDRPASLVYATVNSFQRFSEWSPWAELDPAMQQSIEGPRSGVGAKLSWSGNDKVGTGTQVITASVPNESVTTDLDFGDMGTAKAIVALAPTAAGTTVTWSLDSDMGASPIGRYFGLFMDSMVGKDYERGLAKLKAVVEQLPPVDIAGLQVTEVELAAQPIAFVSKTTATDVPAIAKGYEEAYSAIGKFLAKHKLGPAGAPIGIDRQMSDTSYSFDAAMPIDRGDIAAEGDVQISQSYAGKALKHTHVGPYETLADSYARMNAYVAANGYQPAGATISWYVDDPEKTPPESLRTEMYWPVR